MSLRLAVGEFCQHYHRERNHQGLENTIIELEFTSTSKGKAEGHERLVGLLRFHYREAA
jgi:hypothetical protein